MDLSLSEEQSALADVAARLYAKESNPERVRGAETAGSGPGGRVDGFDPQLWRALVQAGMPTMGLPEAAGGADASLTDLAVVAEQHGRFLASAPLLETMVVTRLLAQTHSEVRGDEPAAIALQPAENGVAHLVPGGAIASLVVALDGDELVSVSPGDTAVAQPTLHAGAVGDIDTRHSSRTVLASGKQATQLWTAALDEWHVLTACALAGLARAAFDLGLEYVKERVQFGVPIGSFQAIQHRLADIHTAVEGARLLAYEAAWAADTNQPNRQALAAQAFWFAGRTAEDSAATSLHYHGGYGFMLEYDIQLYLRRAKGWRLIAGDPHSQLRRIAHGTFRSGPGYESPHAHLQGQNEPRRGMDFGLDTQTAALRDEIRAFIDEHLTPEIIEQALATGTMHNWEFHRRLCERGYLAAGWPTEVGGLGLSAIATTTLMQELYRAGAPVDGLGIAAMVGATLLLRGNDIQRNEILPRILAGEILPCLGYSEPDAGSDVASAQTRAVRDGSGSGGRADGEWVINGQKMFTTMAHEAAYVFLLTRTNPDAPKHKGLTMFLVPMDLAGIEVQPVETLGGERTNITFYSDVRVPDSCRVGDVDDGWSVMHAALVYERAGSNWGEPAQLIDEVAQWAAETNDDGIRPLDSPVTQERLARWVTHVEVGRLLLYRSAWLAADGALPQVEGSMAKLWLTETFVAATSDLLDLVGPSALAAGRRTNVLDGLVEHGFRHALVTTIYGGSSEVQREIISQRGLGLPRLR